MLETAESWASFVLVLLLIGILIGIVAISLGTRVANIKNIPFKKTACIAIVVILISVTCAILFAALPFANSLLGFVIGLILTLFVFKVMLDASFNQTFVVWLFGVFSQVLAIIISTSLFIGGIKDLLKII